MRKNGNNWRLVRKFLLAVLQDQRVRGKSALATVCQHDTQSLILSRQAFEAFVAACENPPEATAELRRLLAR